MGVNDLLDGLHSGIDVSEIALFLGNVIEGAVEDLDRVHAAGDFDDGGVVERGGEGGRFNSGTGDDELEIRAAFEEQLQVTKEEIDIEAAFVGFITAAVMALLLVGGCFAFVIIVIGR